MELTRHHQLEEFGKIHLTWRCLVSYHLPESSLLESILAEQCVHHQEGP